MLNSVKPWGVSNGNKKSPFLLNVCLTLLQTSDKSKSVRGIRYVPYWLVALVIVTPLDLATVTNDMVRYVSTEGDMPAVMSVDLCSWCYVLLSFCVLSFLVSGFHVFVSCLAVFFVCWFPCPSRVSWSFKCLKFFLFLPLSVVLFYSMFLLCAPPSLVATPGPLPPLSPHLFLVWSLMSVLSLCFPSFLCLVIVCLFVCLCAVCLSLPGSMSMSMSMPTFLKSLWYVFLDFYILHSVWILDLICILPFLFALCCFDSCVATLFFGSSDLFGFMLPGFCIWLKIKLAFVSPILPPVPWVTAFGSILYHSFLFKPQTLQLLTLT